MIGKRTREALYVHRSAWRMLPSALRQKIVQAERLAHYTEADVAKIRHDGTGVSLLDYPGFSKQEHPQLVFVHTVDLRSGNVRAQGYASNGNQPILHRKEEMVAPSHPRYREWAAQTKAEEECGLYPRGMLSRIGFRKVWEPMWKKAQPCLKRHLGR